MPYVTFRALQALSHRRRIEKQNARNRAAWNQKIAAKKSRGE